MKRAPAGILLLAAVAAWSAPPGPTARVFRIPLLEPCTLTAIPDIVYSIDFTAQSAVLYAEIEAIALEPGLMARFCASDKTLTRGIEAQKYRPSRAVQ